MKELPPVMWPGLTHQATLVCEVPKDLGQVTGMEVRLGRLVCRTESGIDLILPPSRKEENHAA